MIWQRTDFCFEMSLSHVWSMQQSDVHACFSCLWKYSLHKMDIIELPLSSNTFLAHFHIFVSFLSCLKTIPSDGFVMSNKNKICTKIMTHLSYDFEIKTAINHDFRRNYTLKNTLELNEVKQPTTKNKWNHCDRSAHYFLFPLAYI